MKSVRNAVAAVTLSAGLLLSAVPAWAHQGWTQPNASIVEIGDVSHVSLLMGNHTNEHRSYRIDGNWGAHELFLFSPDGKKTDITSTEFYTGENDPSIKNSKINNEFIASFIGEQPGAYIVSAQAGSVNTYSGYPIMNLRNAKSFVAVSDIATSARVQSLKGFQKIVAPDRGELIPLFNPVTAKPGDHLRIKFVVKGQPVADAHLVVVQRSNKAALDLKTDANGEVSFQAGKADHYLVAAKPEVKEKVEGKYDAVTYEATMMYAVQNSRNTLAKPKVEATPEVFVNGKQVLIRGLLKKNGVWTSDINALKFAIHPSLAGKGEVDVVKTLEASGYTVEMLQSVGNIPALIHVIK